MTFKMQFCSGDILSEFEHEKIDTWSIHNWRAVPRSREMLPQIEHPPATLCELINSLNSDVKARAGIHDHRVLCVNADGPNKSSAEYTIDVEMVDASDSES